MYRGISVDRDFKVKNRLEIDKRGDRLLFLSSC